MNQQLPLYLPGALLGGIILSAFYVLLARKFARYEMIILAGGLIAAALVYVVLGRGAASPQDTRVGLLGLGAFGVMAIVGARWWPPLIGIGWLLHAVWDVLIHWPPKPWVPALYPLTCGAFDLLVAAYFLFLVTLGGSSRPEPPTRASLRRS